MNLFEKLGLVERNADNELNEVTTPAVHYQEPAKIDVNADIDSAINVVEEIYEQNNLADKSNSIYTVQALIDTLPEEMTTAKKQTTVSGILMVSGKSVEHLLNDAQNRVNTLDVARDEIVHEKTAEIEEANRDIEALKEAIEVATIKIKAANEIISATNKSVDDEINIIDGLVKFCEGMNK